jgi:hypothetical protein
MSEDLEKEILKELREIRHEIMKTNRMLEQIGSGGVSGFLFKRK